MYSEQSNTKLKSKNPYRVPCSFDYLSNCIWKTNMVINDYLVTAHGMYL